MRPTWLPIAPLPEDLPALHSDPLMHAILARRLDDPALAEDFLDARQRPAPDPHRLPGLSESVERIVHALRHGEGIGIFGDYDTDGVTSAAILTLALRSASQGEQPVAVRLPRRSEGYGLSVPGVEELAWYGATLLIAVDCGSKDHAAVARARDLGMDVIILDHHRLSEPPPEGAIFASAQQDPAAPYRAMSAAGLSYLLATALAHAGFDTGNGEGNEPTILLDLAMIGLIGDVSRLLGENRALVRDGLRHLRVRPRLGLQALADAAGIDLSRVTSSEIAYAISPRLNAPGRIDDPRPAYELLVASDPASALKLAAEVERANQTRRLLQERVMREVDDALNQRPELLDQRLLIFRGDGWDPGIVGLAASKLADTHRRPVIVLSVQDGVAHGSARSIPGFDITSALTANADLLIRHGGHERAAGLALPEAKLAHLEEALQHAVVSSAVPAPGAPTIEFDAELPPERMRLDTARLLQTLGPFGEGNPVPILRVNRAPLRDYLTMGRERQHLKLRVGSSAPGVDALLWNGAARSRELLGAREVDLAGSLELNQWNGTQRAQMRLLDFRVSTE